ncbi:MAG: SusC/RagA family TonB-linked outer membrane protein [Cyclobacteriaceae bacterium]
MRKSLLLSLMLLGMSSILWAQDRSISGRISSSSDGSGLPGVNVVVKGTTTGTITDFDGNYRLSVPSDGGTLVFTYIGYATQEVEIGSRSVIDVSLAEDVTELVEVVVTAQGIKKDKKALGYAVHQVDGDQVAEKPEADIARLLRGKVPGMNITQSNGVSGTGSNIIIRGYTSITGSNQPLFVVDGVPFNSATNTDNDTNDFQQGGGATSSRFLDLDPNNVESISVLKGLSATVIYGELGRNGVVLVTTKNGRTGSSPKKMEVSFNQSYFTTEIASLPDYQNQYGGGFHQNFGFFFSNWGPHFDTRGQRGINADGTTAQHPIERLTDPTLRNQFPELASGNVPYFYQPYDNVGRFFQKGNVTTTSVAINAAKENTSYGASFSYTRDEGFVPQNVLEKFNFGVGGNAKLSNKLTLSSTFNVAITDMATPPINASSGSSSIGQSESIFGDVFYTPRSVDLNGLPFQAPLDGRPVYYRSGNDITNPNWTLRNSRNTDDVTRFYGKTSLTYDIAEWINVMYRVGLDTYSETQNFWINRGSQTQPNITPGVFRTANITNTIWDHSIIATINKRINEDIGIQANIGANARQDLFDRTGIESTNQLVFGFIEHSNFTSQSAINSFSGLDIQNTQRENLMGLYGQITADYKDFLFLNVAGRNDWSSSVEKANRSLFYPSVSLSFVPTSVFDIGGDILNYLKFRVGYGTSAGFPDPYNTRPVLNSNARAFVDNGGNVVSTNGNSTIFSDSDNGSSAVLGNPNLKPELQKEFEVGVETKIIQNKIGLNVTLYRRLTQDLITQATLDPATGFTSTLVNIGEIENRGIELDINATPVQVGDFRWDLTGNFFAYKTDVNELTDGLSQITIAGFTNQGNFAIVGRPFNMMQGSVVARDANGQNIIETNGLPRQAANIDELGDPNPDFTTSLINTFSWKGITLSAQLDYREGGAVHSLTNAAIYGRGVSKDTERDRTRFYVMNGVQGDGTPNNQIITATNMGFDVMFTGPDEFQTYDGTTIRLRDVSLAYTLPKSILDKTPFGELTVTFSGQNLWYDAINFPEHVNADSEVTSFNAGGNGLGFDYLTGPSSKRYGVSLRARF